jgi:internalin A
MMSTPADKPRRPRLRISIGAMMLAVLVVGVPIARQVNRANGQRRAVEAIKKLGGSVLYDFEYVDGDPSGTKVPNARPPGPAWLRLWLGDEFFQDVVQATLTFDRYRDADLALLEDLPRIKELHFYQTSKITNDGLVHLRGLTGMRWLDIYRHKGISDAGLAHLKGLTGLETLHLDGSSVTDDGLDSLAAMKRLEKLDVDGTSVSNAGLLKLKGLPRLKQVYVQNSRSTQEGVDALKVFLPQVKVELGSRPGSWKP